MSHWHEQVSEDILSFVPRLPKGLSKEPSRASFDRLRMLTRMFSMEK
jgi:hypothetical protein